MPGELGPIKNLINSLGDIVAMLIPIMIGAALVVFFYGLIKYILKSGKGGKEGRQLMLYGLIALFVMISVYGLIRLGQSALGLNNDPNIQAPRIPQG